MEWFNYKVHKCNYGTVGIKRYKSDVHSFCHRIVIRCCGEDDKIICQRYSLYSCNIYVLINKYLFYGQPLCSQNNNNDNIQKHSSSC